jgi:hypothetical protein
MTQNPGSVRFARPPLLSDEGYEIELGQMMIQSDADKVIIDGRLELRRDHQSLKRVEIMRAMCDAFLREVGSTHDLPEVANAAPITSTTQMENPWDK